MKRAQQGRHTHRKYSVTGKKKWKPFVSTPLWLITQENNEPKIKSSLTIFNHMFVMSSWFFSSCKAIQKISQLLSEIERAIFHDEFMETSNSLRIYSHIKSSRSNQIKRQIKFLFAYNLGVLLFNFTNALNRLDAHFSKLNSIGRTAYNFSFGAFSCLLSIATCLQQFDFLAPQLPT